MSHFTADSAMEADQRQAGGILPQDVSVRGSPALEPGIKTLLHGNEDGDVGVMSSGGDCPGEAVVEKGGRRVWPDLSTSRQSSASCSSCLPGYSTVTGGQLWGRVGGGLGEGGGGKGEA